MNTHHLARNVFGAAAFVVAALVIFGVLSPFVRPEKLQIANIILGNVLSWPLMVLTFHFGTSAGSVRKTEIMNQKETSE